MSFNPRQAALILSACLFVSGIAVAGVRPRKPPFREPYDVVSSIDARTGTMTIKHINSTDHQPKIFKVDSFTEVQVNGNKATLNDVKKGMKVDVTAGLDAARADRLVLSPAPPTPAPHPRPTPHPKPTLHSTP